MKVSNWNELLKVGLGGLIIFLMLYTTLCFGVDNKPTEMGLMIVSCSIAIAFINIDKYSSPRRC